jgi:hypothetical protein
VRPRFPAHWAAPASWSSGISERRPDTQFALPVRLRADQAVAKCFGFLARSELGDDLPCQTVDDDEILQGAGLSRRIHQTPGPPVLTKRDAPTWGSTPTKDRVVVPPNGDSPATGTLVPQQAARVAPVQLPALPGSAPPRLRVSAPITHAPGACTAAADRRRSANLRVALSEPLLAPLLADAERARSGPDRRPQTRRWRVGRVGEHP